MCSSDLGADAATNVTDIASQSLYGAGRFGYSFNQFTASVTNAGTASAAWSDFNFDADYSSSFGAYKKILVPISSSLNADLNGVRAFTIVSGSTIATATITVNTPLQAFTTISNNTASFVVPTSSMAAQMSGSGTKIGRAHV